jgi:large subunit ribosomal protein L4
MENQQFFQQADQKKQAIGLIHRVYLTLQKNSRNYLASTKTKSEVRGGGKKPWKQKGTGQARAGSIRSPLWVGGGVSFGPKPKIIRRKINKKERRLAILSALYLKQSRFLSLEEEKINALSKMKTKQVREFLNNIQLNQAKKILFIFPVSNRQFWLATKNLTNIETVSANSLNLKQLLEADYLIFSPRAFQIIHETYGNKIS